MDKLNLGSILLNDLNTLFSLEKLFVNGSAPLYIFKTGSNITGLLFI